jgi:hypothetical protein
MRWTHSPYHAPGKSESGGRNMVTYKLRSESPRSSRFPGDIVSQKGRNDGRQMATATPKARAKRGATAASMEFLIVEDNGGEYHWTLQDRDGNSLARSRSFASYERTEDAARVVLSGAGSARLDPRMAPDGLAAKRN